MLHNNTSDPLQSDKCFQNLALEHKNGSCFYLNVEMDFFFSLLTEEYWSDVLSGTDFLSLSALCAQLKPSSIFGFPSGFNLLCKNADFVFITWLLSSSLQYCFIPKKLPSYSQMMKTILCCGSNSNEVQVLGGHQILVLGFSCEKRGDPLRWKFTQSLSQLFVSSPIA